MRASIRGPPVIEYGSACFRIFRSASLACSTSWSEGAALACRSSPPLRIRRVSEITASSCSRNHPFDERDLKYLLMGNRTVPEVSILAEQLAMIGGHDHP